METKALILVTLLSGAIVAGATVASAEIVREEETAKAEVRGGLVSACFGAAEDKALKAAVIKAAEKLRGRSLNETYKKSVLRQTRDFVYRLKREEESERGNVCQVRIQVLLDDALISKAITRAQADVTEQKRNLLGAVGVFFRFLVDGKSADEMGFNPEKSLARLKAELGRRNIYVVDMTGKISRRFQRKQKSTSYKSITGLSSSDAALDRSDKVGALEARASLINSARLMVREYRGTRPIDVIAVGEVDVTEIGENPDGPGFLASVQLHLSLLRHNGADEGSSEVSGRVRGRTYQLAVTNAMRRAIEAATDELSDLTIKALRSKKTFRIVVSGIRSNRRQIMPMKKAFATSGVMITGAPGSGHKKREFTVAYSGSISDLETAVDNALTTLEEAGSGDAFRGVDMEPLGKNSLHIILPKGAK